MSTVIRLATAGDVVDLAEIDAYVQHLHHEQHPHVWSEPSVNASTEFFNKQLSRDDVTTLVLEHDGEVAGYVLYELVENKASLHKSSRRVLNLEHIAVRKTFEGRGFGKQLLEHVKSVARDERASDVELSVWRFNDHAIDFYSGNDFVAVSQKMQWRIPGD